MSNTEEEIVELECMKCGHMDNYIYAYTDKIIEDGSIIYLYTNVICFYFTCMVCSTNHKYHSDKTRGVTHLYIV